jgi:hypothetical protein
MKRKLAMVLALFALAGVTMGQEDCSGTGGGGGGQDTGLDDPSGSTDEPQRSPQRTRRFSGNGSKNIGTIKVTDDAVLTWKSSDDGYGNRLFTVYDKEFKINVNSQGAKGRSALEPGTYKSVNVDSVGDWSMTIKGR